ncbi:MAG: tyrosine-type recombinase/integrase [Mycobacterium sp.]
MTTTAVTGGDTPLGQVTSATAAAPAASAVVVGPDMQRLRYSYPPRAQAVTWPTTELNSEAVLTRLLSEPFTADIASSRDGLLRRRRSLHTVLGWLAGQPGDTWQARWLASGADVMGNADWVRPALVSRPGRGGEGVTVTSGLRVCVQVMVSADVIRPSLGWVLTPRAPQNLVPLMAGLRDPAGFAELVALCEASGAGRTMKKAALRRAATILAVKGGTLRDITVGDCLELSAAVDGRSVRRNAAMGFYQLLHTMGVFGPDAPPRMRAFTTQGQLSPAQLIDRHGIACRPVRDLLVAYLQERQPTLDHTSLTGLAAALGGLFWRDLERHHPGINSLHLPPDVAAGWKQRVMIKTRRVLGPDGQVDQVRERRAGGLQNLAVVRAFYLDIAQWAMEEPGRWGPWAAPCPVRAEDLARQKELRSRKSRMDQRTRERLAVLPRLARHVHTTRLDAAARLHAARDTDPGATFTAAGGELRRTATGADSAHIWAEPVSGGKRRDLTGEEDRAFWTWAAVETLRHTGIRIEELTELSHHSLIQYSLPSTGELVPLLQIAPSKSDTERLLVVSPELADVLAAIISRIRRPDGSVGCVTAYDPHERIWNPPMPLLFQRRFSLEQRAIPGGTIADWLGLALRDTGITDAAGRPLQFTPHDFRRMFITDAVLHGMPPHIAQLVAGHRDINTTMGYKAVYPEEVINGHRAFITRRRALRPAEEYRVPTEKEWDEFLGHFQHRKLALGTCGRSYATPCIHEHACLRCPLLRPDPAERDRLVDIRDNLIARIAEARQQGWLGEVEGLQVSLQAARHKLEQVDQIADHRRSIPLGLPTFGESAGRTVNAQIAPN